MQKKDDAVRERGYVYQEILPGIMMVVFFIFIFTSSFSLKGLSINTIDPGFMPKVVSVLAIFCIAGINIPIVRGLIKNRKGIKDIAEKSVMEHRSSKKAKRQYTSLITLALIGVYIFLMGILGFLISTTLYLYVQISLLAPKEKRKPLTIGIISIVFSTAIYFIFRYGFIVLLPEGILG